MIWRRPRSCDTSACPAVAFVGNHVLIRDDEEPDVIVAFKRADWKLLVDAIKAGEYDL